MKLFKEPQTGRSKGSGMVKMRTREDAIQAMQVLDERHTMKVREADMA